MSEHGREEEIRLSAEDVDGFADKLERWADGLAPAEQSMLQLLLGRAEAGGSRDVKKGELQVGSSPGETAVEVLRPLLKAGATARMGALMSRNCNWSTWSRGVAP